MSSDLVLYTNPMSRGRVARWMLEETGLPYDTVLLDFDTTMKAPDYLAINPMGKVPALRHGDTVVTENAAICAYLADLVPDRALAPPPGSKERGSYYRWLFLAAGPAESALTAKMTGVFAPAGTAGYGNEGDTLDVLEQALQRGPYLAGDRFTAGDLYVAAFLAFFMRTSAVAPRPAFAEFAQRQYARPAAVRAAQIDDALAKASAPQ